MEDKLKHAMSNEIYSTSSFKGEIIEISEEEFRMLWEKKFENDDYEYSMDLFEYNIIKHGEYLFIKKS